MTKKEDSKLERAIKEAIIRHGVLPRGSLFLPGTVMRFVAKITNDPEALKRAEASLQAAREEMDEGSIPPL